MLTKSKAAAIAVIVGAIAAGVTAVMLAAAPLMSCAVK